MSTLAERRTLTFTLDPAHEAHEPPEARGERRDAVRLLVSDGKAEPIEARFSALGELMNAGDLLVVNTSATVAGALDGRLPGGDPIVVHLSGELPGDLWLVEVRQPEGGSTSPLLLERRADIELLSGGQIQLLTRFADSRRLWIAKLDLASQPLDYLCRHGRPIRYRHVAADWPLSFYQTIFGREPGSAEMPSASRPFTSELVTDLATRGVLIAPLLLHTGVSSLEGDERPYPERFRVPAPTAAMINHVRSDKGRVVAVGTTVVRALATVTDERGYVHPGQGWTDVVVSADRPVSSLDGLLTGWHEPESTHLQMLEAFADTDDLASAYQVALDHGYLWHEFGDSHLLLRDSVLS
jgi:S-adenosylmethionine:tRNA ribosyltransferase-isomerase